MLSKPLDFLSEAENIPFENYAVPGSICHLLQLSLSQEPLPVQAPGGVGEDRGAGEIQLQPISCSQPLPQPEPGGTAEEAPLPPLHRGTPVWKPLTPQADLKPHLGGHVSPGAAHWISAQDS